MQQIMSMPIEEKQTAEWQTVRLGDLISLKGGLSYKGEFISDSGNSLVTMGCITPAEKFKRSGLKRYIGEYRKDDVLHVRDIVIATRDVTQNREVLGCPALIPENLPGDVAIAATNLYKVKNFSQVSNDFLYWVMKTPAYRQHIIASAKGTTVLMLTKDAVENYIFRLPPLPEQRLIASILGSLDDKIELNRQMNETLEQIAQALFKSWFVDFDPVRAKAEGRDTGLPKEIADLFPDSFENSELGEIPKGWKALQLGELLELAYGKALKDENRKSGDVPVFGSNGRVGWHDEKLVQGPGIVVGRKGNPGIVKWVQSDFFPIDTTFYVVPKAICPSFYFLYFALLNQNLRNLGADSAVPGLNRNAAYQSLQVAPPVAVLEAFNALVAPIFEKSYSADIELTLLTKIRDTLLSKLLSGQLSL